MNMKTKFLGLICVLALGGVLLYILMDATFGEQNLSIIAVIIYAAIVAVLLDIFYHRTRQYKSNYL
ncbi:MAG: hypothetical protein NWF03_03575 [Candidatus Bathyarchaeota archaeon]|nr:hypothetical protein [Candidatus Bathyarchaeota archaeon]